MEDKEFINNPIIVYEKLQQETTDLKAENDGLKAVLEPYKHPDVITLLTNWRTGELDRTHNKIANERDKYHQTLQEIKDYLNTLSGIDNDFVNTETYLRILDCIAKAESEEE